MFEHLKCKEDWRLMWQCLERSKDYREYCEWNSQKESNPDIQTPKKFDYNKADDMRPFSFEILIDYFPIHSFSFDEWWNDHLKNIIREEDEKREKGMVINYTEKIEKLIDSRIKLFKRKEKRKLTLNKLKGEFLELLEDKFSSSLTLKIYLNRGTNKELTDKCKEIIRKSRKEKAKRIRKDEIERYLQIYDLKEQGMKWQDIIKKIGTPSQREDPKNPDLKRVFTRDLQKAKYLIQNAELCEFPIYTKPAI